MTANILHFHTNRDSDPLRDYELELVELAVEQKQITSGFAAHLRQEAQRRFTKRKKVSMLRASL